MSLSGAGKVVCVTGASGYISSGLVKLLLQRDYTVKGSVRDPNDPKKTQHLTTLDGAKERLQLYKANLLEQGSFDPIVEGYEGVFHIASPFYHAVVDPQAELIDPAIKGTLYVLSSCAKVAYLKRVVLTSSFTIVLYNGKPRTPEVVVDETWFSIPDVCKEMKLWYVISKTFAEEAAWKFVKEKGIDMVTINPAMVIGPLLQPTLNTSDAAILNLINGSETYPNASFGWVNVKDVAEAHILAFEVPSANGRFCLVIGVYGCTANMDNIIKAQWLRDSNMDGYMPDKKTMKVNPTVLALEELRKRGGVYINDKSIKNLVMLLFEKDLVMWLFKTTLLILDSSLVDLTFLVCCITKYLMFSSPRLPEITGLEERSILRREE